jgi:hypothetical protein
VKKYWPILKTNFSIIAVFLTLIICVFAKSAYSSLNDIVNSRVLGCYEDTIIDRSLDGLILNKIKRILDARGVGSNFKEVNFTIKKRYMFTDLNSIRMYEIDPKMSVEYPVLSKNSWTDYYQQVLLNTNDSSIYYFGDKIKAFSSVIKSLLPAILANNKVAELVAAYIMASNPGKEYYVIENPANLVSGFEKYASSYDSIYTKQKLAADIKLISKTTSTPDIKFLNDGQEIKIFTWEQSYGEIESWIFRVNKSKIKLVKRSKIASGIGPFGNHDISIG